MTGFQVNPSELHSFAKDQLTRQQALEAAADKASGVDLGGDTFGVLLQFFANDAEDAAHKTVEAIRKLADGVGDAAENTKTTALFYEQSEDANRGRFGGSR
ncbi:Excreted virulence factor EspC, type VII ESX diderm [Lentzea albidocapillata subsp. violacea]|uniref:Excreted virulence factor EspC, type VII ESX diderm n=1 Tax=Lentzea albidocapillata subsp. violacea TaxID=128104 RepID=A0A1G9KVU2_9PSEU|nr:type VII secretion target [Lentzea albidocapillata]SDL53811.1 Excreted virulence factor EspC, type VII ESX diderm [Lentzea albidocapillata subsp. violacea]